MLISLVPVFITAGFLESYVTRYTEMPIWLDYLLLLALLFLLEDIISFFQFAST